MKIFFRFLPLFLIALAAYLTFISPTYAATCSGSCFDTANTPSGCSWNGTAQDQGCASQWHCYSCSACSDGCFSTQLRTGITRDSTGGCNIVGPIAYCPGSSTGTCGGNSFVCTAGGWAVPTPTPTPTPTPAPLSVTAVGFDPDRPPSYQYYDDETIQLGAAVSNSVNSVVWTDNGANIGTANCSGGNCTHLPWSRATSVTQNESHTFTAYAYNGRSDWWNNPSRSKSLTIIPRNVRVTAFTTPSSGATYKYYEDIEVRVFVTADTTDVRYYDGNAGSGTQIGAGSCSGGACSGISWTGNKTVGSHTIYAYPIRSGTVYWNNFLSVSITITLPPAPVISSPQVTPTKVGTGGNLTFTASLTNAPDWKFALDLHCNGDATNCQRIELGYGGEGLGIAANGSVNKLFTPGQSTTSPNAYIQIVYGKRGALESYTNNLSTVSYTVVALPTITSVSVNSSVPQITITGTGFKPTGAEKGLVRINGFDVPSGNVTDANWTNTLITMDSPPYAGTINRVCLGGTDFTTICSTNASPSYKVEPDNTWWNFTATSAYSISGNLFVDANKNSLRDNGESLYADPGQQRFVLFSGSTRVGSYDTSNGTYVFTNLISGTYTVRYSDPINGFPIPSGYQLTTPSSRSVTVGPDATNIDFGISNLFPWFQGVAGDMRLDSGFKDPIPTDTALEPYASLPPRGGNTTPGIGFSGNGAYNFCADSACPNNVSTKKWLVGGTAYPEVFTPSTSGTIIASYDYLITGATQAGGATDLATKCTLSNCTLPANLPNGVYTTTGDFTLNAYTFPADKDYVFLIGQDLIIKGDIIVPNGSTATFAAARDISIDRSVGQTTLSSKTANIEGFYTANGSFIIEGTGSSGCPTPDRRLNVAGSIVVNAKLSGGRLQNQRDLCSSNLQYPSLYIVERPDFILYAPEFIKQPNFIWKEVAP